MNLNEFIGIGLRHQHYKDILKNKYPLGWLEIHSENFFIDGGPSLNFLNRVRIAYPISLHGIGLSLGSAEAPNINHLTKLKKLIHTIDPFLISEHLSWNHLDNIALPDLFPIPYNKESLDIFAKNIDITQNFLGKELLIENPSSYIEFKSSTIEEPIFLEKLIKKTGCKILLDINNIFVSACNHGWDSFAYINAIPNNSVKEIHLAGHSEKKLTNGEVLKIDTHDNFICENVFNLYEKAIQKFGIIHSLIEWDKKIPSLDILVNEAQKIKVHWPANHRNKQKSHMA